MIRAVLIVVFGLVVVLGGDPADAARRYAAIVVDHDTGEVLHSRRADERLYPASMTKMMTLYMLFDALERGELRMDSRLTVSRRAAGMPASRLGLKAGSTIRVETAILALAVKSANDVAVVVAEALAGTESQFGVEMTRRARRLGMRSTTFKNASGLPNRDQQSSARDMALLSQRLITDHPRHYHYFSRASFKYDGRTYRSHNRLLASYRGMDGLKTGYIRAAGFNLAATAIRNGRRVVVVVFGGRTARSRDREVARLLDLGFERLRQVRPKRIDPPIARPGTVMQPVLVATAPQPMPRPASNAADLAISAGTATVPATAKGIDIAAGSAISVAPAGQTLPVARPIPASVGAGGVAPVEVAGLAIGPEKSPARGSYAVQVGAYHDHQRAREAAYRAAKRVPQILLLGDIDISALQGRRKPVYRARVTGFSRDLADKACTLLRQQSQDCLVVQMPAAQVASS